MNDALFVRRLERVGDLAGNRQGLVDGDGSTGDSLGEVLPLDPLHGKRVHLSTVERRLDEAVDVRDVRVAQRRQRLCFAREPGKTVGIERKRGGQDLDRDVAVERGVARPVDLPHPARAGERVQHVWPNASTGREGHRWRDYVMVQLSR